MADEINKDLFIRVLEAIRGKLTGEETELISRILAKRCDEPVTSLLSESLSTSMARDALPPHLRRKIDDAVVRQAESFDAKFPNAARITVL